MTNFKIKNLTKNFEKRHPNYNQVLDITYNDGFDKIHQKLNPDDELFLTIEKLPISVHKLRISGLVNVTEISKYELEKTRSLGKNITTNSEIEVTVPEEEKSDETEEQKEKRKGTKKHKTTATEE